jgi:hypothetical protein
MYGIVANDDLGAVYTIITGKCVCLRIFFLFFESWIDTGL